MFSWPCEENRRRPPSSRHLLHLNSDFQLEDITSKFYFLFSLLFFSLKCDFYFATRSRIFQVNCAAKRLCLKTIFATTIHFYVSGELPSTFFILIRVFAGCAPTSYFEHPTLPTTSVTRCLMSLGSHFCWLISPDRRLFKREI